MVGRGHFDEVQRYVLLSHKKPHTLTCIPVVAQKDWRGLRNSTFLSRAFSDQGVRLRLRKEARSVLYVPFYSSETDTEASTSNHKRSYSEMAERQTPHSQIMPNPTLHHDYGNAYTNDNRDRALYEFHNPVQEPPNKRPRHANDHLMGASFHGNVNSPYTDAVGAPLTTYTTNGVPSHYSTQPLPPPGSYGTPYGYGTSQTTSANIQAYSQYSAPSNNMINGMNAMGTQTAGGHSLSDGAFVTRTSLYPAG